MLSFSSLSYVCAVPALDSTTWLNLSEWDVQKDERQSPKEGKASYNFLLFVARGNSSMLVRMCKALNQPLHMLLLV